MESRVNYTVVGIFVVSLSIAMTIIFLWLSSLHAGKSYKTYLLYVNENVTGLNSQSPVRYNGVPVGFVKSIELDPRNAQFVKIILSIEVGTPITTCTVATLQFQGITGVLYVGLKTTSVDAPLLLPLPGEKYPIIPTKPSFFVQLSEVLPEITKNFKKIGNSIDKLLDKKNQEAIAATLQNLKKITKTFADNSDNISQATQRLPKTLKNMGDAAKSVQNFTTQLMPGAQQAVQNFGAASQGISRFTDQLEQNPSMLIRGKPPAVKGPGE